MATKALRGIHVFWWVAGFFAVTVALDSLFVVWAIQTFPGEQVKNSYVLGLDFNHEVARRKAQERLGWSAEIGVRDEAPRVLVTRVKDANHAPVTDLQVSVSVHVAGESGVRVLKLAELRPGEYGVPLELPSGARIEIATSASTASSAGIVFEAAKTLVLP